MSSGSSSNTMAYAEQEEICYQWLRFRPEMTLDEASAWFKTVFAVTLTASNYTRAKDRLTALPQPKQEKQKYVVALMTLFPTLTVKQVKTKSLLFYGQDMRDDVVHYWQTFATEFPMDRGEARRLVDAVESRKASGGQAGFDLSAAGGTIQEDEEEPI